MKVITLFFDDDEFEKLVKLKEVRGKTWHDFIIELAGFKLKENKRNGNLG